MAYINDLEKLIWWFEDNRKTAFVKEYAASRLLGISSASVRDLVKRKKLDYICLNGQIHIPFVMSDILQDGKIVDVDALEREAEALEKSDNAKQSEI